MGYIEYILGLYWDKGKNGNYYSIVRYIVGVQAVGIASFPRHPLAGQQDFPKLTPSPKP